MNTKLTVLVTCKDEQHNIRACIESARDLADEVLVADSGSTDDTLRIVRAMGGCRIIQRNEYVSAGNFKNWAIPHAANSWILVVDSDERVTEALAADVRRVLSGTPEHDGYRIRFQAYFLGHAIKHCGWNNTSAIRLFRRDVCRYRDMRVHSDVDVATGNVGRLKGKFLHFTCSSLTEYVYKVNRYTAWSAEEMHAAGRRVGPLGLLLRAPQRFVQMYLLRGGVLDGMAGLVVCAITGFYTFMKYAKLWELQQARRNAPHDARAEDAHAPPVRAAA